MAPILHNRGSIHLKNGWTPFHHRVSLARSKSRDGTGLHKRAKRSPFQHRAQPQISRKNHRPSSVRPIRSNHVLFSHHCPCPSPPPPANSLLRLRITRLSFPHSVIITTAITIITIAATATTNISAALDNIELQGWYTRRPHHILPSPSRPLSAVRRPSRVSGFPAAARTGSSPFFSLFFVEDIWFVYLPVSSPEIAHFSREGEIGWDAIKRSRKRN